MKNSSDPSVHQGREREMIQHMEKLLEDDRLRIDTVRGRRPVTGYIRDVNKGDRGVELKRLMAELGRPDRDLESRMPVGASLEVTLSQGWWWFFKKPVGRLHVMCVSPSRELVSGESPGPLSAAEVRMLLGEIPPPLGGVPTTLVLVSTGGFEIEARALAERGPERTVILVEPNEAGGWHAAGPAETQALVELFDPEAEEQKRQRVREAIESRRNELAGSGVAGDVLASRTQLPIQIVEDELKSYARENPGLAAKRLDGRVVLYRESAAPVAAGGSDMALIDRMKSLFSRKGDNEKKIALLSERRAALGQQRDRAYEDIGMLEEQESDLRREFRETESGTTKRRITSQLLHLRKEIERRQQLLGVVNQQMNVVSTHLHNLELVQQGQTAKLPDSEELTADAAAAEEMLAELEADHELAGAVGTVSSSGMTAEEQALFEELERESKEASAGEAKAKAEAPQRSKPAKEPERPAPSAERTPRRQEPEAG